MIDAARCIEAARSSPSVAVSFWRSPRIPGIANYGAGEKHMTPGSRGAALTAIAGAGLLLGGVDAMAASQSFSVQESTTAASTLMFSPFQTSLGTLTEVDISLSNPLAGIGASINITGGEGGNSATAGFSADLNITGPGSDLLFTGAASSSTQCTVLVTPGSCSNSAPVTLASGAFTPGTVALTNPTDLAFWDTLANVGVGVAIDSFTTDDDCATAGAARCTPTDDISFTGTLTVTYQYTPASGTPTPEPWSLAIFGSGLAGLGFMRLRRQ
jgi:hypothetical protein